MADVNSIDPQATAAGTNPVATSMMSTDQPANDPTAPVAPVTPPAGASTTASQSPVGSISGTGGSLPGTTLTPQQMDAVTQTNINNATNPVLPQGAAATPVNQQVQAGEMLSNQTVDPNADQVNTNDANIQASTVGNVATAAQPGQITAATYQAATVDPATLANVTQAVTASLPADALVSNQLQSLLTPDANGNLPSWVQPAVTAANQFLASRGISNSTMAGQAITSAILTAAIPIATSNANAELTAFQQNLSNEQQAAMQNGQAQIQAMFTNQAAQNAAANFNATSEDQTNQFMASLATQVNQFNAAQTNAISQFNASQTQSAATSSAQLLAQLDQFNANMANQREQFNTQNAIIIQQSNAEYLRAVNTANTAVANQDNQLNAQNAMNLSDTAMANLQQQFNDEATMLYNSNMTAEEQNYSLTYLSQQYGLQNNLDTNITDAQENQALQAQLGTLVGNLFNPSNISSAVSAVSNLFNTPSAGNNANSAAGQAGAAATGGAVGSAAGDFYTGATQNINDSGGGAGVDAGSGSSDGGGDYSSSDPSPVSAEDNGGFALDG